jgi:cell volume regulation protein A
VTGGQLILAGGGLLAGSVAASLVAARLHLPVLLLFLAIGMAAGSDGAGWIAFDDYTLAREIGMVALALILFDGGLRAGLSEISGVLGPSLRLAVGGTVVVALVTAVAAVALFRISALEGLLLGSIIASTDSAAVFGILRGSTLSRRLVRTLEGEAGFNDPVALILVLGFMEWARRPDYGLVDMAVLGVRELVLGALCGYLVARLAVAAFSRLRLPFSGLYPVASVAVAALAYGTADSLHGSAFLAVYLAGLILGDAPIPGRQTIGVFHDGIAWVAQVGLFLTLGLLVFPSQLGAVAPEGAALGLIVVLIARPLATMAATAHQRFSLPERAILSWAGLRGAAPIVFATFPVAGGISGSKVLFDIVFFAVVVSTLLQGLTFESLARKLGLTAVAPLLPRPLVEFGGSQSLGAELLEYPVTTADGVIGRRVRDLKLPLGSTLMLIVRGAEAVPPSRWMRLKAGDMLHLLVRKEVAGRIPDLIDRLREPVARPTIADRERGDLGFGGLRTEPWTPGHGDPADPDLLSGVLVVERLRVRRDRGAAVVRLEDGRYAVTGTTLAVGPARVLLRYANRCLAGSLGGAEAAWWHEVAAALRG